jgi:hypothetical protein
MTTIYIGNLPNDTDADRARALFSSYGRVESIRLTLGQSNRRFQGFGYVEMEERAAKNAIAELDGSVFEGAILCVHEASGSRHQGSQAGGSEQHPGEDMRPSNLLRRYYQVASVEKTAGPGGAEGDDWYRYVLASGPSRITGFHRGSLEEVTEYATDCAAAFNLRSVKGKVSRTMAMPRKK